MSRTRLVLCGALATLALAAAPASASVVPRDGVWAGSITSTACDQQEGCDPTDEQAYFKLRSRVVSSLSFTVLIACHNTETRETYDRYFTGGTAFPRRQRIPNRLSLAKRYNDSSDGRSGSVTATFDFRGRQAKLRLRLAVSGSAERCTGRTTIPLLHGTPAEA